MALNYITTPTYSTSAEFWTALVGAATFWEETTETTATVGGITITYDSENTANPFSVSGYGLSMALSGTFLALTRIAATENGILFCGAQSTSHLPESIAIGKNADGDWGAFRISKTGNASSSVTPDSSSTSGMNLTTVLSTHLTQLVPVATLNGDFVFADVYRLVMSTNTQYLGRIEVGGQKFVLLNALALTYTDD